MSAARDDIGAQLREAQAALARVRQVYAEWASAAKDRHHPEDRHVALSLICLRLRAALDGTAATDGEG